MLSLATREGFSAESTRLRPVLMRVAITILGNGDDAADAVQDTFVRLWMIRGRLDGYRSVDALARVIVRNRCLNILRSGRAEPLAELPDMPSDEREEDIPDEMATALEALPSTEQAVLRMKHLDGLETEEIAEIIQSTPGAVRTALCRARRRIRDLYLNRK